MINLKMNSHIFFEILFSVIFFIFLSFSFSKKAASIALKKYVHDHWKPDETEEEMESDFTNDNATILQQQQTQQQQPKQPEPLKVEVGAEEKKLIRDLLPRGLADESSQIRTGLGMCIAQIAQWDWPNEWPSILEHLAVSLQSTNLNLVQVIFEKNEK